MPSHKCQNRCHCAAQGHRGHLISVPHLERDLLEVSAPFVHMPQQREPGATSGASSVSPETTDPLQLLGAGPPESLLGVIVSLSFAPFRVLNAALQQVGKVLLAWCSGVTCL